MVSSLKIKKNNKKDNIKKIAFIKGIIVCLTCNIIGGIAAYKMFLPKYRARIEFNTRQAIEEEMARNQVSVWVVNKDVEQGDEVSKGVLKEKKISKELVPENISNNDLEDKIARLDLNKNTILTNSMIVDSEDRLTDDLRRQDYSHIKLNDGLEVEKYVDIRLKLKNGMDFIVASKKKIKKLNGSIMHLDITEVERNYLNIATVHADIMGGMLYTTIYVDPENQPAATVTYKPDKELQDIVEKNPKLVEQSAKNLEERLKEIEEQKRLEEEKKLEEQKDKEDKENKEGKEDNQEIEENVEEKKDGNDYLNN